MALLNLGFALLLVKISICVLPGFLGLYILLGNVDKKRDWRNILCSKFFGVRNAIPYPSFARTLLVIGTLLLIFSVAATWFLLLRNYFASGEELRSQIFYSLHLNYFFATFFY